MMQRMLVLATPPVPVTPLALLPRLALALLAPAKS